MITILLIALFCGFAMYKKTDKTPEDFILGLLLGALLAALLSIPLGQITKFAPVVTSTEKILYGVVQEESTGRATSAPAFIYTNEAGKTQSIILKNAVWKDSEERTVLTKTQEFPAWMRFFIFTIPQKEVLINFPYVEAYGRK